MLQMESHTHAMVFYQGVSSALVILCGLNLLLFWGQYAPSERQQWVACLDKRHLESLVWQLDFGLISVFCVCCRALIWLWKKLQVAFLFCLDFFFPLSSNFLDREDQGNCYKISASWSFFCLKRSTWSESSTVTCLNMPCYFFDLKCWSQQGAWSSFFS